VSVRLVLDGVLTEQVPLSQIAVFLDSLIQDGADIALLTFSNPDAQKWLMGIILRVKRAV
jgi:hypothetical protein